jgi:hypothetical protein
MFSSPDSGVICVVSVSEAPEFSISEGKLVRLAGLEPARLSPLPPQSSVSANSTISATVGPTGNVLNNPPKRKHGISISRGRSCQDERNILQHFSGIPRHPVSNFLAVMEVSVCGNPGGNMDLKGKSRALEK